MCACSCRARVARSAVALLLAAVASAAVINSAHAKLPRSASAKAAFMKAKPCPATGIPRGACSGYVIDHVIPLCAGGLDEPSNMQWQTLLESRVKDREERAQCRAIRSPQLERVNEEGLP